jgi:hypothetical protein
MMLAFLMEPLLKLGAHFDVHSIPFCLQSTVLILRLFQGLTVHFSTGWNFLLFQLWLKIHHSCAEDRFFLGIDNLEPMGWFVLESQGSFSLCLAEHLRCLQSDWKSSKLFSPLCGNYPIPWFSMHIRECHLFEEILPGSQDLSSLVEECLIDFLQHVRFSKFFNFHPLLYKLA